MGRKATNKKRNSNRDRAKAWVELLIPNMQHKSLGKLTIDDFAALMGKSKSTVYQYFRSKEEIVDYAVALRLARIQGYEHIFSPDPSNIKEEYRLVLEILAKGLEGMNASFLADLKIYYPATWHKVEAVLDKVVYYFQEFYTEYMERGLLRPVSIELLTRMDRWFAFEYLLSREVETDLAKALEDYVALRFEGILYS